MINSTIAAGWIAAVISGVLTAFAAWFNAAGLNPLNFIDSLIFFALAFGISRKSRICALLALAYHLFNQAIFLFARHITLPPAGLALAAAFALAYLLSIIGAFAWQAENRPREAAPGAV